jgi:tetratricopeptide (TPR) repeat protein
MNSSLRYVADVTVFLAPLIIAIYSVESLAVSDNEFRCGPLQNAHGPFDYRSASAAEKSLVEGAHFTSQVEQLIRAETGYLGQDIDYTLRAFPNHPRALKSMMELGFRSKTDKPFGAHWPVWCYFDRAIRFKNDDPLVKLVYAMYLHRKGKSQEAIEQLKEAETLGEDSANLHYNMALIYLDVGDYESSLSHAHKAYGLGFQLEGLRNRLKRANKWKDPLPGTAAVENDETTKEKVVTDPSEKPTLSDESHVLKGGSVSSAATGKK